MQVVIQKKRKEKQNKQPLHFLIVDVNLQGFFKTLGYELWRGMMHAFEA